MKRAISDSTEFSRLGEHARALTVLDQALAEAVSNKRTLWIHVLCRHAAVICESQGDLPLARQYYEQLLEQIPDEPTALYGLAEVLFQQGQIREAKQYASKCYQVSTQRREEGRALIELLAKRWPEFGAVVL